MSSRPELKVCLEISLSKIPSTDTQSYSLRMRSASFVSSEVFLPKMRKLYAYLTEGTGIRLMGTMPASSLERYVFKFLDDL